METQTHNPTDGIYAPVGDYVHALEIRSRATSQIALPQDACDAVYATDRHEQSISNMTQVSLTGDNVSGTTAVPSWGR